MILSRTLAQTCFVVKGLASARLYKHDESSLDLALRFIDADANMCPSRMLALRHGSSGSYTSGEIAGPTSVSNRQEFAGFIW
jgi:hypothetical protein